MVIITLETETTYNIRTNSYMVQDIDWHKVMKVMTNDNAQYSIKVIQK